VAKHPSTPDDPDAGPADLTRHRRIIGWLVPLMVIGGFFLTGWRPTQVWAARAHSAVPGSAVPYEWIELDGATVVLLEGPTGTAITACSRRLLMWRCPVGYAFPEATDSAGPVKTVGWLSLRDPDGTVLAVRSEDPAVAAVEAGPVADRRRIETAGDVVVLSWTATLLPEALDARALDAGGDTLYVFTALTDPADGAEVPGTEAWWPTDADEWCAPPEVADLCVPPRLGPD
jgi:hypothetical protein